MAINYYGQQYNPYTGYPVNPGISYDYRTAPQQPQMNYNTPIPQKPVFVDGEMSARVFQMPDNWPVGVPLYLWDTDGNYFYVKMIGQNGIPMPLKKFRYNEEQEPSGYISGNNAPMDMAQFVTKEDLDKRMNELKDMMRQNQGNRPQSNQQNRGGSQ